VSRRRAALAVLAALCALAVLAAPVTAARADTGSAAAAKAPACPASVTAPSAIVVEVSSGEAGCAKHAEDERPIASTTKLMTALLALERLKLRARVPTSSYRPSPAESVIGLLPGERLTVRDLLHGLLVFSGNDAAMALASGVSGSEPAFVRLMNRRARQLGLTETHYENPIGLDAPGNFSSAHDLVKLATVLRTNAFFRNTVDAPGVTLRSGSRVRHFLNRNDLVRRYAWVNGVKTGHTRLAGYVLVGSARRHGVQVVSAVLGTPDEAARDLQSLTLLRTGLGAFRNVAAAPPGRRVPGLGAVPIRYRPGARLRLVVGRNDARAVVRRGHRDEVVLRPLKVPRQVSGPIRRGQVLGTAQIMRGSTRIGTVPLVAFEGVPAASAAQRTRAWFTTPWAIVLAFAVVGGTVLALRRRTVRSRRPPRREAPVA
jgi:D-alanyl-D-alanine carboxypeptidase (penicillin-binding protein 5/6)